MIIEEEEEEKKSPVSEIAKDAVRRLGTQG